MSTLTEQIAAVKRVIDECVANGYDDFQDDPHTFGHLTSMRAVLAKLEGMAAPEEIHDLDAWIDEEARLAGQMMRDSPSPQQPTQDPLQFAYDTGMPKTWVEFAASLDRFAAQRVTAAEQELEQVTAANARWAAKCQNMFAEIERLTAAPVSGDAREVATELVEQLNHRTSRSHAIEMVEAALTAGADKARREADREIAWLRRLLRWCRARLSRDQYQDRLDKYLAAGPTDAPEGEPQIVASVAPQNPAAPEKGK